MNRLKFLSGDKPAEMEEPVEERVEGAEEAETPSEPEPTPQPVPEPPPEPTASFAKASEDRPPAPVEPGHVPISAMLDEREKRQALEKQLAEFKARVEPPAPLEPTEQLATALYAQNLRVSRKFAERQYGADTLAKVHDWAAAKCDADPIFNQQMRSSDDPYEDAMQAFNRERVLTEVKADDLDAFLAWKAANGQVQAQALPETPSTPAAPPPRSLVNASGNGSLGKDSLPAGEGQAFAGLFKQG